MTTFGQRVKKAWKNIYEIKPKKKMKNKKNIFCKQKKSPFSTSFYPTFINSWFFKERDAIKLCVDRK
jgi:hypothetical protein